MFSGKRVAVVVPAHNEARLLPRVLATMPRWVDVVIVVDDGSTDRTSAIAASFAPRVAVVTHPTNRGVGAAIATGYRAAATDHGADVVAVMAADAQMRPDELWSLVGPIAAGHYDYVKGNRLAHPHARRMPLVRRFGTVALTHLTRVVSGYRDLEDAQCGYTALSAALVPALPLERLYPRYGYPNDLLVMLAQAGARLGQRVVTPVYADEESGLRPHRALFSHSWVLLRAAARRLGGRRHPVAPALSERPAPSGRRPGRASRSA